MACSIRFFVVYERACRLHRRKSCSCSRPNQARVQLRLYFARPPSTISFQESVLTAVDLDAFGATMNHAEVLALSCARQADRPGRACGRIHMWAGENAQ